MSLCTDNHNTFRTHWEGYSNHTLEPRCHLRNAPILVNAAIDKYNSAHTKNKYKRKRAALPNIPELLEQKPLQCEICGKREATTQRLEQHKNYAQINIIFKKFYLFFMYFFLLLNFFRNFTIFC